MIIAVVVHAHIGVGILICKSGTTTTVILLLLRRWTRLECHSGDASIIETAII